MCLQMLVQIVLVRIDYIRYYQCFKVVRLTAGLVIILRDGAAPG